MAIWCDTNPRVKGWNIEEIEVKYHNPVRGKISRYIIDFYVELEDGEEWLVEIEPHKETLPPVLTEAKLTKKGKPKARYKRELDTYAVNQAKWAVAKEFAENNGAKFYVFTEKTLDKMGIRRLTPSKDKDYKRQLMVENRAWRKKPSKPRSVTRSKRPTSVKKKKPKKKT